MSGLQRQEWGAEGSRQDPGRHTGPQHSTPAPHDPVPGKGPERSNTPFSRAKWEPEERGKAIDKIGEGKKRGNSNPLAFANVTLWTFSLQEADMSFWTLTRALG